MSLLRLNKSVHYEATSLLYACHFTFCSGVAAQIFLSQIGAENRRHIRQVQFYLPLNGTKDIHSMFVALINLPCLKHIRAYCWTMHQTGLMETNGKRFAEKVFRDRYLWFQNIARLENLPTAGLNVLSIPTRSFGYDSLVMYNEVGRDLQQRIDNSKARKKAYRMGLKELLNKEFGGMKV
jgi:hypothetical protein